MCGRFVIKTDAEQIRLAFKVDKIIADIHDNYNVAPTEPVLAIVRRDAFVPTLFAYATQQPVALRPPYDALAEQFPPERLWSAFASRTAPLDKGGWVAFERYDYVVFLDRRPFTLATTDGLRPVFLGPRFQLLQVLRPSAGLDGIGAHR